MSYPCGANTLGKTHRMGGSEIVYDVTLARKVRKLVKHPNPGKINFRRSDARHPGRNAVISKTKWPPILQGED